MKIVINKCHGGFGLSDKAYTRMIELGVPVKKYKEQVRGEDGKYLPEPENDEKVIFDRELTPLGECRMNDIYHKYKGKNGIEQRYWEVFIERDDPMLIQVVEELREEANSKFSKLKIVEIPDGTKYTIEEYDGLEHISEEHNTWN